MSRRGLVMLACLLVSTLGDDRPVRAQPAPHEPTIGILLGPSGRGDRGFNDNALDGLAAASKQARVKVLERAAPAADAYGAAIDELATAGADLIIGVGFLYAEPFRSAAARHPARRFLLLDAELAGLPNVRAVTFRADEGSFLAGVAAAAESKRAKVGFVGGMDMPIIRAFECGYESGVRWAARELGREVRGYAVYVGATPEAFANPAMGAELARELIVQKGVDVLYAAAGASGLGVIEAARAAKLKAIGVDADQSLLAPGTVVTSMRKRLDRAVETAVADLRRQSFTGGTLVMRLANGGVDLVLPGALAPSTRTLLGEARAALVAGRATPCAKPEERSAPKFPPRR